MTAQNPITVSIIVHAPIEHVWDCWNNTEHITGWAFASDDWEASNVQNDIRVGGHFSTTMSAKDKSSSFDFTGTYTAMVKHALIEYDMDDGRHVKVVFETTSDGVMVTETFDPEQENSEEIQRDGWQAILENFKKYTEQFV